MFVKLGTSSTILLVQVMPILDEPVLASLILTCLHISIKKIDKLKEKQFESYQYYRS